MYSFMAFLSPPYGPLLGVLGHAVVWLARYKLLVDRFNSCFELLSSPFADLDSALAALAILGYPKDGWHVGEARVRRRNMRVAGCSYWPCACKKWVTEATMHLHEGPQCSKKFDTPIPYPYEPPIKGDKYDLYFNAFWEPTTVFKADALGVYVKWVGHKGKEQYFTAAEWTRRSRKSADALSPAINKRKRA